MERLNGADYGALAVMRRHARYSATSVAAGPAPTGTLSGGVLIAAFRGRDFAPRRRLANLRYPPSKIT